MILRKKNSGVTNEIRIRRCYGCGAVLQDKNPKMTGYIPTIKLKQEDEQLCERCYKLRHYNEQDDKDPQFNSDYESILKEAVKTQALIVYVLDIFSLEASFIANIGPMLGTNLLVILNKRDILPKSLSDDKIIADCKARLKSENVFPTEILITSSHKNYNIDILLKTIETMRKGKNVYFVGASQVGKSSLINNILKSYKNQTNKLITTSHFPGTTLDVIQIPLDKDSYMYDTPGIFKADSLLNQIERQLLKYVVPRTEIRPGVYQSNSKQSYCLGAIARIDFIDGPKTNFTFMLSNDVTITRTKLEKADHTFDSLALTKQIQPASLTIKSIKDLDKHDFVLPVGGDVELLIVGLGYVTFKANGQKISVYVPHNVACKVMSIRW